MAYLILLHSSIGIARGIRFIVSQVILIQRMPFLFFGCLAIFGGRFLYSAFNLHKPMVIGLQWVLRLMFFFRGIHIRFKFPKSMTSIPPGIHLCNCGGYVYWLLFSVLPYNHLIISYDEFFSTKLARSFLFLLGFYPQEYGYSINNYQATSFRLDPYLDQGFSVWQPIYFQYRDFNPLPYALILGLKRQSTVSIWTIDSLKHIEMAHWLNRRTVQIELVHQLSIGRRLSVTLASYHQTIARFFPEVVSERAVDSLKGFDSKLTNSDSAKPKNDNDVSTPTQSESIDQHQ